jgi:hypothetical protein
MRSPVSTLSRPTQGAGARVMHGVGARGGGPGKLCAFVYIKELGSSGNGDFFLGFLKFCLCFLRRFAFLIMIYGFRVAALPLMT